MKIKLIDIERNGYETTFGTCELCMWDGYADETTYIFDIDGERREVEGWVWDWGDFSSIWIENTADFAHWLNQQPFPSDYVLKSYSDLDNLVDRYNDHVYESGR